MNRRALLLGALVTAPTAALAACVPGGTDQPPADREAGPVTVKLGVRGTPDIQPLFEAARADFMQRQSRVRVELWVNEPDYYTKLPVAFTGGDSPGRHGNLRTGAAPSPGGSAATAVPSPAATPR